MKRIFLGLALLAVALAVACAANPGGGTHTVYPGDTLSGIAALHDTTMAKLVALNKARYPSLATKPALIQVGWQLALPRQGAANSAPAAKDGLSAVGATQTWTPPTAVEIRQVELEIIRLTNEARREQGLPDLVEDPLLAEIARERARQLPDNYSHFGPNGEVLCRELAIQRGYHSPLALGENIDVLVVSTPDSARWAVAAWMNSPGHRDNILHPEFTRIGVGISGNFARWYGVQLFDR